MLGVDLPLPVGSGSPVGIAIVSICHSVAMNGGQDTASARCGWNVRHSQPPSLLVDRLDWLFDPQAHINLDVGTALLAGL